MVTPHKKKMIVIQDCRECENFLWDFDVGRFKCTIQENKLIEDLHIIPDWCPLPEAPQSNKSNKHM